MNGRFEIFDTRLQGLKLILRKPLSDSRGYLERLFCAQDLKGLISGKSIVQINRSLTVGRGTVRGMHFQHPPHTEFKFVSCLRGKVFDVVIDLRRGSATFLMWHAEILSADNCKTVAIPEGFAHGFQTLVDDCEMLYFHTTAYVSEAEGGLNAQDPGLSIQWPLRITEQSSRDQTHPLLTSDFAGLTV